MKIITAAIMAGVLGLAGAACAQGLVVEKGEGGSVKTELGYGITLNKNSSLTRQWYLINDPRLPLQLYEGSAAPKYKPDRGRGDYQYDANYVVSTRDKAVTAFEVRFLVLDVFGVRQRLLSATYVMDIPPESKHSQDSQWHLFSETDAATAFYSIGYVAAVRTDSGQIYAANMAEVLKEVQKISSSITAADIEPEKPARKE